MGIYLWFEPLERRVVAENLPLQDTGDRLRGFDWSELILKYIRS
ncbi:hypothetical protein BH09VER1_BH09VER1_23680 [soil metagenome]